MEPAIPLHLLAYLFDPEEPVLAADLAPGDSGAALVDTQGQVVGVAFAIAPDRGGVAYALSIDELREVLAGDLTSQRDTGGCLS